MPASCPPGEGIIRTEDGEPAASSSPLPTCTAATAAADAPPTPSADGAAKPAASLADAGTEEAEDIPAGKAFAGAAGAGVGAEEAAVPAAELTAAEVAREMVDDLVEFAYFNATAQVGLRAPRARFAVLFPLSPPVLLESGAGERAMTPHADARPGRLYFVGVATRYLAQVDRTPAELDRPFTLRHELSASDSLRSVTALHLARSACLRGEERTGKRRA